MRDVRGQISDHLDPIIEQGSWAAKLMAGGENAPRQSERLGDILLGALAATPQVTAIIYMAVDGTIVRAFRNSSGEVWRVNTDPPADPKAMNKVLERARDKTEGFWNEIFFSEEHRKSFVNYIVPVRREGVFLGAVLVDVSLKELSDVVSDISMRLRGTVFVLLGQNRVIAHPILMSPHPEQSRMNPTVGLSRVGDPVLSQFWSADSNILRIKGNVENVRIGRTAVAGTRYVFLWSRVLSYGETPWIIGGYLEASDLGRAMRRVWNSMAIGLVVLVIGVLLAVFVGRAIARPVKAASEGISSIADLEIGEVKELPRSRLSELDTQAVAFNTMLGALRWFETYVPRSLVQRLMRRGDQDVLSEERDLTILFTDLVHFTATTEAMSAGETAEFLNNHFALIGRCVEDEGGTTDKFIGDALMAFWGAPDNQSDHAARALRAVQAMALKVRADNKARREQGLSPIRMRIGLHSGKAVVGNIGAPGRMNYTVVGDTVNTAQRIEQLGKEIDPDAEVMILVSAEAIDAAGVEINGAPAGLFRVKGKSKSVEVVRISCE